MEGRPGILSGELSHVRARKLSKSVINTIDGDRIVAEEVGHTTVKRSPPTTPAVPKDTSLADAEHSPVASGSRLQLPGDCAAEGAASFPECNRTGIPPLLLSPLLPPFYPASPGRTGGRVLEETSSPRRDSSDVGRRTGRGAGGEWEDEGEGKGEGRGG